MHQTEVSDSECVHRVSQQQGSRKIESRECYRCGNVGHIAVGCPYASYSCHRCGMKGHLEKKCRQEKKKQTAGGSAAKLAPVRKVCSCNEAPDQVGLENSAEFLGLDALNLYALQKSSSEPVMVEVRLNGRSVRMEVDTGAAVTVMSLSCYERVRGDGQELQKSELKLKTYTGEIVSPEGVGAVEVKYRNQKLESPITVVMGHMPNLMGRDWLERLKLKWEEVFPVTAPVRKLEEAQPSVANLVKEFPDVFTEELGCLKGFKVHIP